MKGENGRFVEGSEWTICRRERMEDLHKGEIGRFVEGREWTICRREIMVDL